MPKFSISDENRHLLLVPFSYAFFSRYGWPRGFVVNASTSWIPGVILVAVLAKTELTETVLLFFCGYLAFICIYEIGYLTNDTYGLRNDPTPRPRINISLDSTFIVSFVVLRLCGFASIALWFGMVDQLLFWAGYGSLVLTLILHNTLRKVEFKFVTFLQLSLLRFTLPVLLALLMYGQGEDVVVVIPTAMLLFTYPRLLTYLDAKGRLYIPERKISEFHLISHILVLPVLLILVVASGTWAPIFVWTWLASVQFMYICVRHLPAFAVIKEWFG